MKIIFFIELGPAYLVVRHHAHLDLIEPVAEHHTTLQCLGKVHEYSGAADEAIWRRQRDLACFEKSSSAFLVVGTSHGCSTLTSCRRCALVLVAPFHL